ncbi:hypothetical protein LZ554_001005 [Drepanopeziza brunnea f. sp. 'monogermtubi']|nr:hypothetical protein LZ554_001005 [Drepanopeziza brunnea f. sp. 'monogermtubi']
MLQNIRWTILRRGKASPTKGSTCEENIQSCARLDVLTKLGSSISGLLDADALRRLETNGENITLEASVPGWKQLASESIFNSYNALLIFLAIISVVFPDPDWTLFVIILIVVPLAASINFCQEYRSVKAAQTTPEEVAPVNVRRQSVEAEPKERLISPRELVPGDVLILSAGDVVPADCKVLKSSNLCVSQSSLTGESQPQPKDDCFGDLSGHHSNVFDLPNVLFSGSKVISGSGLAVAFTTGKNTYISAMAKELNSRRAQNSFQKSMNKIVFMMIGFMLISFTIVLVIKGCNTGRWQKSVMFALSTAATLVPEMLPAIVTTNLYRGKHILSKKTVIVRHMETIQSLGSMTILCSDKTGTLTKEDIELSQSLDPSGQESTRVFGLAHTNAFYQSGTKNAIDSAILDNSAVDVKGVEMATKIGEIPFTFEARRSSCIVRTYTGGLKLICKGAYEEVLALCSGIRFRTGIETLNEQNRRSLFAKVDALNAQAFRVILIASKDLSEAEVDTDGELDGLDKDMVVEGLLTFLDPLKDDAKDSVLRLQNLGIDVRILTGDNLKVAISIARSLDIGQELEDEPSAICGPRLAEITDPREWNSTIKRCKIFAKLTPAQKGNVIEALQAQGEVVGMVGDGINDSIALSRADVGISVHSGQAVAKQSADIILQEKRLSTIIDSVMVGRTTHGNIMKYLKLILAANFGNIISVVAASVWFPFDPISPTQMVLQNLLYDLGQITIPFDNVDHEYLAIPRRLSIGDLSRFVFLIGPITSTIDIATFLLNTYYYGLGPSSDHSQIQKFQCNWFILGLLSQILVVYITRTARIPFLQGHPSWPLVISTLLVSVMGFIIPYIPKLNYALELAPPDGSFLGIMAALLVLYAAVMQLVKMLYIKMFNRWL